MRTVFSIDVEEWFHLLDTDVFEDISKWDSYPSRVEETFIELLNILDIYNVKATCFFLGWIAEKYPGLVKLADSKGHEIAVHGYYHRNICNQTYTEFYEEIAKAKKLIESIIEKPVYGFRAPTFSIKRENLWAYEVLMDLGFKYSSSVNPSQFKDFGYKPKTIRFNNMEITEIPMPTLRFPFTYLSCFGGGYFRLFPLFWYDFTKKFIKDCPLTFYIHPRDIDIQHPKLEVSLSRKFKSLVNIKRTRKKIEKLLEKNDFIPLINILDELKKYEIQQVTLKISHDKQQANLQSL